MLTCTLRTATHHRLLILGRKLTRAGYVPHTNDLVLCNTQLLPSTCGHSCLLNHYVTLCPTLTKFTKTPVPTSQHIPGTLVYLAIHPKLPIQIARKDCDLSYGILSPAQYLFSLVRIPVAWLVDLLAFQIVPRLVCLTDYPFSGSSLYSDTVEDLCYLLFGSSQMGSCDLSTSRILIHGQEDLSWVCTARYRFAFPCVMTQVPLDLPNKLVRPDYRYLLPSVTEAVAITQVYFPNFVVGGI